MLRHLALLLCALFAVAAPALAPAAPPPPVVVGPSQILYADADTIFYLRSVQWWSANVRHQEKLLLHNIRMKYWSEHLPSDMRRVFEELSFPTGRVLLTPAGHTEEHWYYGQLDAPLRFRDGVLLNPDRFEAYLRR
jgi:hypothetical protein